MSGLIEKDIRLILQNPSSIAIFVALCFLMSVTMEGSFGVAFTTLFMAIFAVSTVSYDSMNKGMEFLMTLPITAKIYVREKFLFSACLAVVGWCAAQIILVVKTFILQSSALQAAGAQAGSWSEAFLETAIMIPVVMLVCSATIAMDIKYGVEKGKMVRLFIAGVFALLAYFGSIVQEKVMAIVQGIPVRMIVIVLVVVAVGIVLLSYEVSVKALETREY